MNNLAVGQVLSLRIRLNNSGDTAERKHTYIIIRIDKDTLAGKEYKEVISGRITRFS